MTPADIRRYWLREWTRTHGVPPKEKSYFSQLMGANGSFGERAARRLERDYKMGAAYLDQPVPSSSAQQISGPAEAPARVASKSSTLTRTLRYRVSEFASELIRAEKAGLVSAELLDALAAVFHVGVSEKQLTQHKTRDG
jgi:hypothetical protein